MKSKYQEKREKRVAQPEVVQKPFKTVTGVRHSDACHSTFKDFKAKKDAFLKAKDEFLKSKDALRDARGACPNCIAFKSTQGFNMGAALGGH